MTKKMKDLQENQAYNITITGRHLHVTDAMKEYAIDKVSKVERFSQKVIDVVVTMDIQKLDHRVDIVMKVNHIKIKAQATSENMYMAIDAAVHKIEAQLLKYKNKIQKHQAKSMTVVDMNVNVFQRPIDDLEQMNEAIEEENLKKAEEELRPHEIVKREIRPLKILTNDEAIMKMELSGDQFMVFRNEIDQKIKVIYRRQDENFGIIEPE